MLRVFTPNRAAVSACPSSCSTTDAKIVSVNRMPARAALAVRACA